jgi:hypothetical protein
MRKKKSESDKFYTKPEVARRCISLLDLSRYKTIIEPSAGSGSFSHQIKNCLAYDIEPSNGENIIRQDFFLLDENFESPILVIGNPPFGRQASLAIKFIRKAAFADTIAFILPKSFKKSSLKKKVPLNFHLEIEIDLEPNSFLLEGKDYDVPCVFQVWNKKLEERKIPEKLEPFGFTFTNKKNANISVRRVGVYAGMPDLNIADKSEQSHYFLKIENPFELLEYLKNIKWAHNNTVGPRSISKDELTEVINELTKN